MSIESKLRTATKEFERIRILSFNFDTGAATIQDVPFYLSKTGRYCIGRSPVENHGIHRRTLNTFQIVGHVAYCYLYNTGVEGPLITANRFERQVIKAVKRLFVKWIAGYNTGRWIASIGRDYAPRDYDDTALRNAYVDLMFAQMRAFHRMQNPQSFLRSDRVPLLMNQPI